MSLLTRIQDQYAVFAGGQPKAISHRPDMAGRVHILSQYSDQTVASQLDDYADYANVYKVYVWVRKAVSKIAEAVAPLPVRVEDGEGKTLDGHPVSLLLCNANDAMSPPDLWQQWVIHLMLGGESFFELVDDSRGRPVEMWPRRPDQIKIRPDLSPERKLYPQVAGYIYGESSELIPPEKIWHHRFYNPANQWRGVAPITAVREGITIDLFAQAWSKAFLKRGARPDFALVAPQGITPTEREDYEQRLMEKFSGVDNWHKPIVLEDGVTDIKSFSFAPKDIEWLEQRKFSRDEVGSVFGVPDEVMGYGRDTYENMDAAHKWFWLLTLIPLVQYRDSSLTHFFTKVRPLLGPGELVVTDLADVGALQEDLSPKIEMAKGLWGMGVPFNVIDERLGLGIGEVPGGDTAYLPFNLLPMGSVSPAGQGVGGGNGSAQEGQSQLSSLTGKKKGVNEWLPAYGSPRHEAMWKTFAAQLRPHEKTMQRQLKRDIQRQQSEVLRALRGEKGWAAIWADGIKHLKQGDEIPFNPDDLINWKVEVQFFAENYQKYFEGAVDDFGQGQLDQLGIDLAFDLRNPLVEPAIREMAIKFAKDINATTQENIKRELRDVLVEADEGGWAIPDIQREIYDRISTVFNVRKSDYETERIARTEMNKAANQGNLDGMRQSGVVKKKAWLAALDDRVRETHAAAHQRYNEEPIPLEALFEVGADKMPHPGGGSLPEENIFCRCTTIAVIEEYKPEPLRRPLSPFEQQVRQELEEVRSAWNEAREAGDNAEAEGIKGYMDTLDQMYEDERDLNEALWEDAQLTQDEATKADWQRLADKLEAEGYELYKKYSQEGIELTVSEMRAAQYDGYADVGGQIVQVKRGRFSVSRANEIEGQMWDRAKEVLSDAYGELLQKAGYSPEDIANANFDQRRRLAEELGNKELILTGSGRVSRIDEVPVASRIEAVRSIDFDLASVCDFAADDPLNIPTIDAYRKMQLADVIRSTR